MIKIHLGCGTTYLDGYVNIDYPPESQLTKNAVVADLYKDITTVNYLASTVDEVRNHHVFEHFPRPDALALLCRWTNWLKPGGTLRIETPDLYSSAKLFIDSTTSPSVRSQVARHLFGSHEAPWAAHWDGWYQERFEEVLKKLGYKKIKFKVTQWESLCNIEVTAIRGGRNYSDIEYRNIVENILRNSLIKITHKKFIVFRKEELPLSEIQILDIWMSQWSSAFSKA